MSVSVNSRKRPIEAATPYEKGLLAGIEGYLKELRYSDDKYRSKWMKRNPDEKLTKYFNEKAEDNRPDIEPKL